VTVPAPTRHALPTRCRSAMTRSLKPTLSTVTSIALHPSSASSMPRRSATSGLFVRRIAITARGHRIPSRCNGHRTRGMPWADVPFAALTASSVASTAAVDRSTKQSIQKTISQVILTHNADCTPRA
jgi:hypothetical protein